MFSLGSVILFTGGMGASHVTITHDALLDLAIQVPPDMFILVHHEARTSGKRAVDIRLERFLVGRSFYNRLYSSPFVWCKFGSIDLVYT